VEAERALEGKRVDAGAFHAAAEAALQQARPRQGNAFKVELAKRCLVRALTLATTQA
jgi:xanthine dehydrogenase YagS FAD-binding subunit